MNAFKPNVMVTVFFVDFFFHFLSAISQKLVKSSVEDQDRVVFKTACRYLKKSLFNVHRFFHCGITR